MKEGKTQVITEEVREENYQQKEIFEEKEGRLFQLRYIFIFVSIYIFQPNLPTVIEIFFMREQKYKQE